MAATIKPFIFNVRGWHLEAHYLDGNELRCSFEDHGRPRYFTFDVTTGILSEVHRYSKGNTKKSEASDYVATDDELAPEKQYEYQLGGSYGGGYEVKSQEYVPNSHDLELMRWFLHGRDIDWSKNNQVTYIVQRFAEQKLDAKHLIQDLKTLDNDLYWEEIIEVQRFGGGYQLKHGLTLEAALKDAEFY
jgi:hypothetical protein